jgi:hypothetical protein
MSDFTKNIFATPVYAAVSDNVAIQELICNLLYKWKEETFDKMKASGVPMNGLMSYHWDLNTESNSRTDFEKFGITTFYTGNLAENPEWAPVVQFIQNVSSGLLDSDYQGKNCNYKYVGYNLS